MKGLLIEVKEPKISIVDCNSLYDYYKYIHCDCIDVTVRDVGDSTVRIVCDDNGALCDDRIISASDMDGDNIYGNILVFSVELLDGDLQSLTADEMHDVLRNIVFAKSCLAPYDDFHFVLRFNSSC